MEIEKLVRKNILNFQPYIPGKPIDEIKRKFKLQKVDKLASNENPLPPSPQVLKVIKDNLKNINLYPDGSGYSLKQAIAKKYKVKTENIVLGNGSDEIIELLGRVFLNQPDEILVGENCFVRFCMAAQIMGAKVKSIARKDYHYDLSSMSKAISQRTKLIFIDNPNNPTGTYVSQRDLDIFLKEIPDNVLLILDEAYSEYVQEKDYPQGLDYFKKGKENVFVLRTFSKIYSLAGLRIGYGIGSAKIVSYLEQVRPPFNTNILAQAAASVSLEDNQQILKTRKLIANQKKYLYQEFEKLSLFYIPSVTNFILVNVGQSGEKVFNDLLKKGIIVRPVSEYGFSDWIRVTIGTPAQNRRFIKELKEIMGGD